MKPLAPLVPTGPEETWSQLAAYLVALVLNVHVVDKDDEPTLPERPARLKSTAP